jgi:hypothetical protein
VTETAQLRLETCEICKKQVMLSFPRDELVVDITGICQIADLHGTNDEKPHIRILYVDATGSVRSYTIIERIAKVLE